MGHKGFLYLALFLTVVIIIGSIIPLDNIANIEFKWSDKLIHVVAYFMLTSLWFLSFNLKINTKKLRLFITTLVFSFGIIIEVFQGTLTTLRQFDFLDIVANFVGIILAFLAFQYFYKRN
ncbi:VanZ family protein [Lutibacter sp.]|uniref:VanZ family protein n=1 Tax=Lutibacter sp. TaxID=1925666 RepID=UPI0035261942